MVEKNDLDLEKTFHKYRSLKNFKRFMDILINERLYACKYSDMNDYMEGYYLCRSDSVTRDTIQELRNSKGNLRICSLSKISKNDVMVTHYSDGGKGIVLGVKIKDKNVDVRRVRYAGLPEFEKLEETTLEEKAKEILTYKTESWSYEDEIRVFTREEYVKIKIEEIIFGPKISPDDEKLIRDIVKRMKIKIKCKKWDEVGW